jgi:tetratricopeptide (TPR) repeat protein
MWRSILTSLALLSLSGIVNSQTPPGPETCPATYEFGDVVDYLDPQYAERVRGIEHNHLNADVENLIKGQTTSRPGGDLRFILGYVPNHHRALALLMRLAALEGTEMPAESGPYTVRCWMHRATVFSPRDGTSFLLYGVYLARKDLYQEALIQLEQAGRLLPDNSKVEVDYNLGLVYFELKNYEASRAHAERAYEAGFPLPGLRRKLAAAGFPLD